MALIQKYNPLSGNFDLVHSEDSFDDITVVANYAALPAVATATGEFYWCSASQGTKWLWGSLGGTYYNSGLYYSNGTTWEFIETPIQATQSEVNTGTNTDKFVTPDTLTNSTQLQYLDATSSIQTQLDSKQNIPVNGYYGNPFFSTANNSILDSTSIFFGQVTSGANSVANSSGVPQVAGKVIGFAITGFNASTVGSNENCTIVFHYNNVANSTTISTTFKVSGNRSFYQEITGLNIDITSGNTCIELQTPVLATNPNAFRLYAVPIFKIQ